MNCENNFCIYQEKGGCILDSIRINSIGMCEECIYPDIDKKTLKKQKEKLLKKFKL